MKYVLDSSVALKWVLPEAGSDIAIAVRDAGNELLAPDIFSYEVGHVLTKQVRAGRLLPDDALKGLEAILNDEPLLFPTQDLVTRAMDIALDSRCSLWDSFYLALAEKESCQFLTADEKLARNVVTTYKFVVLLNVIRI